jgi:pimeloyl-ACP methyl ester carboxylesterase
MVPSISTQSHDMTIPNQALEHEFAEVNGVRLHYVMAGKGKLVMFVHGFPEFWYEWKNQLTEFGRNFRVVAPDQRGYNLSSKLSQVEAYAIPLLVEDLQQLREHMGARRFVLVGHDWGGVVAWFYALYHPENLEKLVIINAPHPAVFARQLAENPEQQKASQYMLLFRSPQAEETLSANNFAALQAGVLAPGLAQGYFNEEDRKAYLDAWSQPGALTGGLNYYRAARVGPSASDITPAGDVFFPPPLPPGLSSFEVRVPTLVIWGEKDPFLLPANLDGLEDLVPDLTIKRVPDAGHWIVHEKPDLVNATIRDFIQGQQIRNPA